MQERHLFSQIVRTCYAGGQTSINMTYNIPALVTNMTTEMVKTTMKNTKLRNRILNTKDRKLIRRKALSVL